MAPPQQKPPRDHHYIPEFYQRQWSAADGMVERFWMVHGDRIEARRVFPSQAGFKRDLYRAPGDHDDEWAAQRLETDLFKPLDDQAAKALDGLISGTEPSGDPSVRTPWIRFMRSMLHRTPKHLAATLAKYEEIWRTPNAAIQAKYAALRQPWYPPTAEEFLEALNPNEARDTAFRLYFDSLGSDRLSAYIAALEWRIIDCSEASFRLLLSDNPVVLVPLETESGHLAMPLTPSKLFFASAHKSVLARIDRMTPQAIVRAANTLTVERAYHCVIGMDRSQEAFIRRRFGKRRIGSLVEGFRQT